MKTKLPPSLHSRVKRVSKQLGVRQSDLLQNAVAFYLDNLAPYLDLNTELKAWEGLSDESLLNFESHL